MAINLSGNWKNVDAKSVKTKKHPTGTFIKAIGGSFTIHHKEKQYVLIEGFYAGKFENIGMAETPKSLSPNAEIEILWTDTPTSPSPEKNYLHKCKVKIVDSNHMELVKIIKGKALSYGSFERYPNDENVDSCDTNNCNYGDLTFDKDDCGLECVD